VRIEDEVGSPRADDARLEQLDEAVVLFFARLLHAHDALHETD
jgi:hypothetical protein